MKKFLQILHFGFAISTILFFSVLPSYSQVHAAGVDASCQSDSECDSGLTCDHVYIDPSTWQCEPPPLSSGDSCDTTNDICPAGYTCSPNTSGSTTGTCKQLTSGTSCDINATNPPSCGGYFSNWSCTQDPNGGQPTCQSQSCNLKNGSDDCTRVSFYCVEDPKGSGKGLCEYAPHPPDVSPAPGAPCAIDGYEDVSVTVKEKGKDKTLTGKKCAVFVTGLGHISTDAIGFIQTGFGILLAASGGVALILIIRAGYKIMTSEGNPDAVKEGREQLTAAIVGLIFLIFAFVFLELIGVNLLHIPGFTGVQPVVPPCEIGKPC